MMIHSDYFLKESYSAVSDSMWLQVLFKYFIISFILYKFPEANTFFIKWKIADK